MPAPVERILLLISELSFRGSTILSLRLARQLAQQNVEVVILCNRRHKLNEQLTHDARIVTLPGFDLPVWGRIISRTVLSNTIEQPPDIIHVVGPAMLPQGLRLARQLECPIILSLTSQAEAEGLLLPADAKECRAFACVSESVRQAVSSRYDQIEQRVILPGVPLDPELPPDVLADEKVPVVGMAGPLEVIKGGSYFLRACHRVIEAGRKIRVVVTGSGPEEKNLRRLATSLELDDHVTFVDDGTCMTTYLSAIDIFCQPSVQQGFGVIMLEAMALGRPAVASGVGGLLSIIEDGRNGLIVPPSDSRALADSILQLLDNVEQTRRIAVSGRNLVEDRFTVDRMAGDMLALYNDIATPKAPETPSIPFDERV